MRSPEGGGRLETKNKNMRGAFAKKIKCGGRVGGPGDFFNLMTGGSAKK